MMLRRALKKLTQMVFGRNSGALWWRVPRSRVDYRREVGDGLASSVVTAPILWAARTFPEASPVVEQRTGPGEWQRKEPHDLVKLLERPNPFYPGAVLWMATLVSYMTDGNAYWVKIRNKAGRPVQLWYVPHWMIEPKWPQDGTQFISHYEYTPGGEVQRLAPDDVLHYRFGLDPTNVRKGFSPLRSVLREVFTDDEAANFSAALLRNLGVPGVVVSPEGDGVMPSDADVQATKEWFRQNFGGDKRGEPLVMGGPTKVQMFGFSPQQLTLKDVRRIPEERVAAVLGVPAIVAGLGAGLDRSTFANYAEAREAAYEQNIIPTQRMFAAELQAKLLPDFEAQPDNYRILFDLSNVRVLQEDQDRLAERIDRMVQGGWIRVDQAKRAMGIEPEPGDEVYLRRITVIEVPQGGTTSAVTSGVRPGNEPPETRRRKQQIKAQATELQRRIVLQFRRDAAELEELMIRDLAPIWDQLGETAARAAREILAPALQLSGRNAKALPEDEVDAGRILAAISLREIQLGPFVEAYRRHYLRVAEWTVGTIQALLDVAFDMPDTVMREIVATGGRRAGLVDLTEQTRGALFAALRDGRALGEGPDQLVARIRDMVPAGPWRDAETRSRVIARTETKYAQNISSIRAYRETGVVTHLRAFDAQAGPTDEDCEARDGRIFTFEEADYETSLEHPNGTLSWAPVVGGS